MTLDLTLRLSVVFIGLFTLGSLLCLPLFHWNVRRFFQSSLWIKIVWWLPIYIIFLVLCYGKLWTALPLTILILSLAHREYARQQRRHHSLPLVVKVYIAFFSIATLHIILATTTFDPQTTILTLVTICLCSVLSDVCAFFLGSYASRHSLPGWINPGKSWEGVLGQIIGAFVGASLVILATQHSVDWWLVLAIGVASAFGDLFNSIAKRQLGIKDWGQTIPGHGGILDRMSSLSTTFMVATLLLLLTSS
jgi:phosphatidate cytidylyltransferase